jgi:hypothetical protein
LSINSQKYRFEIRDPEKYLLRIADPGVKKAPDPESATLDKADNKKIKGKHLVINGHGGDPVPL